MNHCSPLHKKNEPTEEMLQRSEKRAGYERSLTCKCVAPLCKSPLRGCFSLNSLFFYSAISSDYIEHLYSAVGAISTTLTEVNVIGHFNPC